MDTHRWCFGWPKTMVFDPPSDYRRAVVRVQRRLCCPIQAGVFCMQINHLTRVFFSGCFAVISAMVRGFISRKRVKRVLALSAAKSTIVRLEQQLVCWQGMHRDVASVAIDDPLVVVVAFMVHA